MYPSPPPNRHIHHAPCRVYLQCQDGSSNGQSLWMRSPELYICVCGEGLEAWNTFVLIFPAIIRRILQCSINEVSASHTCHPRLFSSALYTIILDARSRVNSYPRQNRKKFISMNASSPALFSIFAYNYTTAPAAQTPDLCPLLTQI